MTFAYKEGAIAGLAATFPMTVAMAALRRLPTKESKPIPPEHVAEDVAVKLGLEPHMDRTEQATFTWLSHFGFGAAAGSLYPLLASPKGDHCVAKGIAFGLGVWATSYIGVLPALGITPPLSKESRHHLAVEALSHVVWGAALGYLTQRLSKTNSSPIVR